MVPTLKQQIQNAKSVDICYEPPKRDIPVFLVETELSNSRFVWRGVEVVCFQYNTLTSEEGKDVFARNGVFPNQERIQMSNIIQETQAKYAKRHSNITIISASRLKSKSYGREWKLEERNCIVIYCKRKGYIPFLEDPFPTHVKGIPVDVREGIIEPAGIGLPSSVRSGMAISAYGHNKSGTLGPIFEHPTNKVLSALTNAHVVLSDDRIWSHIHKVPSISDSATIYIANPPVDSQGKQINDPKIFGHVQTSAITPGGEFEAGTDVSVVTITSRFPDSGYFPDAPEESLKEIGYSSRYPPLYQGKLEKNVEKWRFHDVIKYGATSGWTRGVPYLTNVFTRRCNFSPKGPFSYNLRNQIEIESLKNSVFGKQGDSGSTIFYRREEDNQLIAVALLNGVTSYGSTVATPIADCLKAVGLSSLNHFKQFPDRQNIPLSAQTRNPCVRAIGHLAVKTTINVKHVASCSNTINSSEVIDSHRQDGSMPIPLYKTSTAEYLEMCMESSSKDNYDRSAGDHSEREHIPFSPCFLQKKTRKDFFSGNDSGYDEGSYFFDGRKICNNEQNQNLSTKNCSADFSQNAHDEKFGQLLTSREIQGNTSETNRTLGAEGTDPLYPLTSESIESMLLETSKKDEETWHLNPVYEPKVLAMGKTRVNSVLETTEPCTETQLVPHTSDMVRPDSSDCQNHLPLPKSTRNQDSRPDLISEGNGWNLCKTDNDKNQSGSRSHVNINKSAIDRERELKQRIDDVSQKIEKYLKEQTEKVEGFLNKAIQAIDAIEQMVKECVTEQRRITISLQNQGRQGIDDIVLMVKKYVNEQTEQTRGLQNQANNEIDNFVKWKTIM